jgi:hypothetical protein
LLKALGSPNISTAPQEPLHATLAACVR